MVLKEEVAERRAESEERSRDGGEAEKVTDAPVGKENKAKAMGRRAGGAWRGERGLEGRVEKNCCVARKLNFITKPCQLYGVCLF